MVGSSTPSTSASTTAGPASSPAARHTAGPPVDPVRVPVAPVRNDARVEESLLSPWFHADARLSPSATSTPR